MIYNYHNLSDYLYEMDKLYGDHNSFQCTPQQDFLLKLIVEGMSANYLRSLSEIMGVDTDWLKPRLDLQIIQVEEGSPANSDKAPSISARATEGPLLINGESRLDQYSSEKLLKVYQMVNLVRCFADEYIIDDSFDAGKWLQRWLDTPLPALNHERPSSNMKTLLGLEVVAQMLEVTLGDSYA